MPYTQQGTGQHDARCLCLACPQGKRSLFVLFRLPGFFGRRLAMQGDLHQFRRVVQPQGELAVAQTAADHHGSGPFYMDTAGVFGEQPLLGGEEPLVEQAELAAVGVAAEREVDIQLRIALQPVVAVAQQSA